MAKAEKKKDGTILDVLPIEGTVAKGYTPEGFDTAEEFLLDMCRQYESDLEFDRLNREAALDDKKFSAGEQWDPIVLEQRKGLPCLVINSIPQFTAQLVGDWREGRKAIKVVPSNDEDTDVASVRGDLIRSIEMQSRADRVYDTAFESLVQCGDGAFRVSVEYARDSVFDQDIFIRPIEDCLSVVWDRYSVDPTGRDAKRVFVDDRMPKPEFERKWPDAQAASLDSDDFTMDAMSLSGWVDDDSVRVTEYWRLVERQVLIAMFSNGKIMKVDKDNIEDLVAQYGPPVKTRMSWCSYAQMHLVTGFAILAGPYEYQLNRLPIIRMSGRVVNVGGRRIRYGLVRFMKDPVRLRNFWRSVDAEQLGYAPKFQWMVTESTVEGKEEKLRAGHLSRDPLMIFNDEAIFGQNVQRVDPTTPNLALLNAAQVNAQDMKDVTGIHDASLGIRSNEISGRAIQARQREGDVASLTFFDNGNASVLEAGDVSNQLIPQIYDGTRVLRLIGEDEAMKFQKINDPMDPEAIDMSVGNFDVALSTGTSYTTRRVESAQAMMDAIQVWPQLMTVAGDLVAKAQDWPGAEKLADRLKKTIPPQFLSEDEMKEGGGPGMDPEQMQLMQQELQKLQMENQEMKMDRTIDMEKLEIDKYNAETQRIRALSDHEVDGNKMEMDAIKLIIDGSKQLDDHDMQREENDHQREMAEVTRQDSKEQFAASQTHAEKLARMKSTPAAKSSSGSKKKSQ